MTAKEKFISILSTVTRFGIDKLIQALEESSFFIDPASASFHGNWEGGLCEHSLAVYEEFVKLTRLDSDSVKIACLLHDVCKIGTYKIGFRNVKNEEGKWEQIQVYENKSNGFPFGHGEKSVLWLLKYISLTEEEMLMIRWHMGAYESKECWRELKEANTLYPSTMYIHFADLIASTTRGV